MESDRRKVRRRSKFYPKVPKNSGLTKDKHAPEIFLRKISEFKRKRKYHKFISISPVIFKGKTKSSFYTIADSLEEFRVQLGLGTNVFYKIVAEFILIPSGRKYYPLNLIFGDVNSQVTEEFIIRIVDTVTWIVDLIGRNFNNDKIVKLVMEFAKELNNRKISTDNMSFESKDWYCVVAIREMAKKKGWSEVELLDRIKKFYKRRMKKVTSEMVLCDITHGELDKMESVQGGELMKKIEKESKQKQKLEREEKRVAKQKQKELEKGKKKIEKSKRKPTIKEHIESQSWYDSK